MYKQLGNFYTILDYKDVEICSVLKQKAFGGVSFDLFNKYVNPYHFSCPFKGNDLQHSTVIEPTEFSVWPDGHYRVTGTIRDDIDEPIYSVTTVEQLKNKDNVIPFK